MDEEGEKWWSTVDQYIVGRGIAVTEDEYCLIHRARRLGLSPAAALASVLHEREKAA